MTCVRVIRWMVNESYYCGTGFTLYGVGGWSDRTYVRAGNPKHEDELERVWEGLPGGCHGVNFHELYSELFVYDEEDDGD